MSCQIPGRELSQLIGQWPSIIALKNERAAFMDGTGLYLREIGGAKFLAFNISHKGFCLTPASCPLPLKDGMEAPGGKQTLAFGWAGKKGGFRCR